MRDLRPNMKPTRLSGRTPKVKETARKRRQRKRRQRREKRERQAGNGYSYFRSCSALVDNSTPACCNSSGSSSQLSSAARVPST